MRSKRTLWQLKGCMAFIPLALAGAVLPQEAFSSPFSVSAEAYQWTVTGRVVSPSGEPLPGVTVLLKGTTTGTATGPDGSYTISARITRYPNLLFYWFQHRREIFFRAAGS